LATALSFHEVTKNYRGAHEYRALRDDLVGGLGRVVGVRREPRQMVRALDDLSLEIPEGEAFAMIGPNGAGKTTALKIATRITYPTSGRVRVRGRVGALIEVGTGMHPELTGRENIRLYGRILGLSRKDIEGRFDEIVEFAGVGQAIDQPVKQYSSGMQLRLGFSVAAHLEPDVLLVDEALAVGDAGFQAKCVERMMSLVREGRTIVFVSHNLYAVEALCPRGIYLRAGALVLEGSIQDVLRAYLKDVDRARIDEDETSAERAIAGGPLQITVRCEGPSGGNTVSTGEPLQIVCEYDCSDPGLEVLFHFGVTDGRLGNLFLASQVLEGEEPVALAEQGTFRCLIPELPLLPRVYEVWGEVRLGSGWGHLIDWQPLARFRVDAGRELASVSHGAADAPLRVAAEFDHSSALGQDSQRAPG
jgi:ABC-type polysaccharide/polyol phosphate transport system ATPase subunit